MKKVLIVLLVILVIIQFIRPQRNQATAATGQEIENIYEVPAYVGDILKRSCNDCHTNYTSYPWYTNVQPIGWWLQDHINEGKEHLNFSIFGSYTPKKQAHKLEEVIEEVKEGKMPLQSYTYVHSSSVLNKEDAEALSAWAASLRQQIIQQHNLPK